MTGQNFLQSYAVPLISRDTTDENILKDVASALKQLDNTVSAVFNNISSRVANERKRIGNINHRVEACQKVISGVQGINQATTVSNLFRYMNRSIRSTKGPLTLSNRYSPLLNIRRLLAFQTLMLYIPWASYQVLIRRRYVKSEFYYMLLLPSVLLFSFCIISFWGDVHLFTKPSVYTWKLKTCQRGPSLIRLGIPSLAQLLRCILSLMKRPSISWHIKRIQS